MDPNTKQNFLVKGHSRRQYQKYVFEDDIMFADFCLEAHPVKCPNSEDFYYPFTKEYEDALSKDIRFEIKDSLSNIRHTKRVSRGHFMVDVKNVM